MVPCSSLSEKAMATHSSTLAWKIPWTEEPGGLQSMGSRRVGDDWMTSISLFTFMHWRKEWQPTPVFLPGESQGRGSVVAAVSGVAQSRTRLKRLSSSSRSFILYTSFYSLPLWLWIAILKRLLNYKPQRKQNMIVIVFFLLFIYFNSLLSKYG